MQKIWNPKKHTSSHPHAILVGNSGSGKSFVTYQMVYSKFQEIATENELEISALDFTINDANCSMDNVRTILTSETDEATFNIQVKYKNATLSSFVVRISSPQLITRLMVATPYPKDEQMSDMLDHIKEITGINMTKKQLYVLLDNNQYLKEQLKKYSFQDTVVRESVSDMISETFIGERWPINGDNLTDKEYDEFIRKIRISAAQQGYQIEEFSYQ